MSQWSAASQVWRPLHQRTIQTHSGHCFVRAWLCISSTLIFLFINVEIVPLRCRDCNNCCHAFSRLTRKAQVYYVVMVTLSVNFKYLCLDDCYHYLQYTLCLCVLYNNKKNIQKILLFEYMTSSVLIYLLISLISKRRPRGACC